jgi:hypothetical protein
VDVLKGGWLFVSAAFVGACQPNLDDTTSIVGSARVLAIQSIPAEAPPTSSVKYVALVAAGEADAGAPRVVWDYCNARNPLSNLGPVNPVCEQIKSSQLTAIGTGLDAEGRIPDLACGNFGPNAPPAMDGGASGQPVDPDSTGGYYQPVSVFLPPSAQSASAVADTLYFMRLSCGFAGANEASQGILTARYHVNANPSVSSLTSGGKALTTSAHGESNSVAKGTKLQLEVSWPECPLSDRCGDDVCGADESAMSCPGDCTTPKGCGGAERYVNFDLTSQTVVDQREGVHVSWFATAGTFDQDRTGRLGSDHAIASDNGWTAPARAEKVHLWVVLHDDRGGIGWEDYQFDVR